MKAWGKAFKREEGVTLKIIFSTREYGRGAIEKEKCTLTLEAWEGGEKDKDNSRITIKRDGNNESKNVKVRSLIYTQNQAFMSV